MLKKLLSYLALFFFFLCSTPAFAILTKAKLWAGVDITGSVFDWQNFLYDFYPQIRDDLTDNLYDETHTEAALGYRVLPRLSLWLGYTNVWPGILDSENDIWEQATWNAITSDNFDLISRTRLEERHDVTQPVWAQTFRERVFVLFPHTLPENITPIAYDELFFNLNHPVWINPQDVNQNRAFAGLRFPVNKNISFDLGYLNQYVFRKPKLGNQDNQIACITLNITT